MTEQEINYEPLLQEHIEALTDEQKAIFASLDEVDRQFFAKSFNAASLGAALERKAALLRSRSRKTEFEQRYQQNLERAQQQFDAMDLSLSGGELALGAAGAAGLVGVGVLAQKIAPQGKATWRGVQPSDLVLPLERAFAAQEKTDIRFDPAHPQGMRQAVVYLRRPEALIPGLTILLTPLNDSIQVEVTKVSSAGVLDAIKSGGGRLFDLIKHTIRRDRSDAGSLIDLAGQALEHGTDIYQTVKDLNLEDQVWEVIQRTADPLQAIFDEKLALERQRLSRLELAWDDYYTCPRCRVEFGAGDAECRVCGTERTVKPGQPDPRRSR
jgi:hypothetical protein